MLGRSRMLLAFICSLFASLLSCSLGETGSPQPMTAPAQEPPFLAQLSVHTGSYPSTTEWLRPAFTPENTSYWADVLQAKGVYVDVALQADTDTVFCSIDGAPAHALPTSKGRGTLTLWPDTQPWQCYLSLAVSPANDPSLSRSYGIQVTITP